MVNISNLNFRYDPSTPLFSNLSLRFENGGIVGLIGANGAGKTSLLKLMAGLLIPKYGNVTISDSTPHDRHKSFLSNIFYVGEEFSMPRTSATTFMERYSTFYRQFNIQEFYNLLSLFCVGRSEKLHRMSFGTRKKVYLAFALATNTEYLLLDEPTNGLDIESKVSLFAYMASVASPERTIIISTHHISRLNILLDRIVILDKGEIALNASLLDVASRLTFHTSASPGALYSTPSIMGTQSVSINAAGSAESVVDLSLLYGAVMANRQFFNTFSH